MIRNHGLGNSGTHWFALPIQIRRHSAEVHVRGGTREAILWDWSTNISSGSWGQSKKRTFGTRDRCVTFRHELGSGKSDELEGGGGVPLMVSSNNASRSADKIEQSTIHRPLAGSSCCQASASPSFERGPAGAHAQKNSTVQTKQDENGKRRREQRSRPPSGSARSPTQWVNAVATRPPPPLPYRHTGRHRVVERMSTSRVHPSVCSPAARRSRHGEATT